MALIECNECKKEVSSDAEVCPHCGKSTKVKKGVIEILFYIVLSAIVIIGLLVLIGSNTSSKPSKRQHCKDMITNMLKSPASADFSSVYEDNLGSIKGSVDSDNSFGATLRTEFICKFNTDEQGKHILKTICLDGKNVLGTTDGCY